MTDQTKERADDLADELLELRQSFANWPDQHPGRDPMKDAASLHEEAIVLLKRAADALSAPTQPAASREDVAAIVRRWANWIIDESADMDPPEGHSHESGRRKIEHERDSIIAALFPTTQAQPADVEGAGRG